MKIIQHPGLQRENSNPSVISQRLEQEDDQENEKNNVVFDIFDNDKDHDHKDSSRDQEKLRESSSTFQRIINIFSTRHFILGLSAFINIWISISMLCIMFFLLYLPDPEDSKAVIHFSLIIIHSHMLIVLAYLLVFASFKISNHLKVVVQILSFIALLLLMIALAHRQDSVLSTLACPEKYNNEEITRIVQSVAAETLKNSIINQQTFCNKTLIDDTSLLLKNENRSDENKDYFEKINSISSGLCPHGESLLGFELFYSLVTTISIIASNYALKLM